MEVVMIKAPNGALIPMDEAEGEKTRKWKAGAVVRGEFKTMRNGAFHKKAFSLLQLCYERFCSNLAPAEYKGKKAAPCFDTWREQFIILSGHYDVSYSITGEIRLKAKSLSFSNCNQDEFEVIYSSLIDCALTHAYGNSLSEEELRGLVEKIISYA